MKINKLRQTLAFRLTFWYAAMFAFCCGVTFILIFVMLRSTIRLRVDEDLRAQANEFAAVYALQGMSVLQRTAFFQAQAAGERKMFFRLFYPSGLVFSSSNMTYWRHIRIDRKAVDDVMQNRSHVYDIDSPDGEGVPVRLLYTRIGASIILQLGYSLESENQLLHAFKRLFIVTISVMFALAVGIGWFMAKRALSGVASVTRTAERISEDDLDTRVPVGPYHDEINRLSRTFNQMLDRIKRLVTGIQQMNDNIAHDLRSPITRIRGLAEVTLTGSGDLEAYRQMAASTIEECDRLLSMINTMLTISRTESGADPIASSPVDLSRLVLEASDLFQALAEDNGIEMTCDVREEIRMRGDPGMLQRMAANLIDNAIKYTQKGGRITVTLKRTGTWIYLTVADTGAGIAPQDQLKVFNRFFRGDKSRSQKGAGLGLSLAKAVAHAHHGDITLDSEVGRGSVFTVRFPSEPQPGRMRPAPL